MKRKLKIEERGDYAARKTFPAVRLKGKWLQLAGFAPGNHLELTLLAPGILELRALEVSPLSLAKD